MSRSVNRIGTGCLSTSRPGRGTSDPRTSIDGNSTVPRGPGTSESWNRYGYPGRRPTALSVVVAWSVNGYQVTWAPGGADTVTARNGDAGRACGGTARPTGC